MAASRPRPNRPRKLAKRIFGLYVPPVFQAAGLCHVRLTRDSRNTFGRPMSSKPRVFVTRKLPAAVEARLLRDYRPMLNPNDKQYGAEELVAGSDGCDGLLPCPTDKLTGEVVARLPASIRVIATFSVGHEHIDLAACRHRGIVVGNTPDVLTDATADIAVLLMLGAARGASDGERLIRANDWGAWGPTLMLGTHMTGKRLGIYGMGRIGQAIAKRARAFDMTIHYHNRARLSAEC